MRLWGPERFDPNVVDERRSRPPSTHCRKNGSRGGAPRAQNRRQAPIKRAAELRLLSTDCCAQSDVCEAAIFSKERATWRVALANKEAPRIEPLNQYHFDEVIPRRGRLAST